MRLFSSLSFFLFYIFFTSSHLFAKETWFLDKDISSINFNLPVLFAKNVKGEFKEFEGLVEIDIENHINNKAIFSVNLESIDMNYKKYKPLIMSKIFFDTAKFPIAFVDTKKFSYKNEDQLTLEVELNIKGISKIATLQLQILHLAEELIQVKGKLYFSRTSYQIGTGKWASTTILKDKAYIKTNLFLFKK
jgi:polyisoprenoid-binding protein YceI